MAINTIKFSQFAAINLSGTTNQVVGVSAPSGGTNFQLKFPLLWTTSTRPASPTLGLLGYNSSLGQYEYWMGTAWVQLASGGTGTINLGAINEIAYYAANGTTISGLPTGNNGVLVTSNTGMPSISSTLPLAVQNNISSLTGLTGYLQAPLGIKDSNGNIVVQFGNVSNAVNFIEIFNNATGLPVVLRANGSDSSINIILATKNGDFLLQDLTFTKSPILKFFNAATTHFTGLQVNDTQSTDLNLTLPAIDGVADSPIITDGASNLSFLPGAWVDFSGTISATGFSGSVTVTTARYKKIGKTVFVSIFLTGTSNSNSFAITNLPFAANASNTNFIGFHYGQDNSANTICTGNFSGTTLILYNTISSSVTGWTNSGTKGFGGFFFYEAA